MEYDELKEKLLEIPYATGFSIYYSRKYNTYNVKLYRNRRRTVEAMLCTTFDECYDKIKKKLMEERY